MSKQQWFFVDLYYIWKKKCCKIDVKSMLKKQLLGLLVQMHQNGFLTKLEKFTSSWLPNVVLPGVAFVKSNSKLEFYLNMKYL